MPVARRSPKGTKTLLSARSPYGSRVLDVECDDLTTAAYLRDANGETVASAWIYNHRPAPRQVDLARLNAGLLPPMPAARTRDPGAHPPPSRDHLDIVWFEEGDGAAVLEDGRPLCVIPGWSDMDLGLPGYSAGATGRSPFAYALDDVIDEFEPRIRQARAYWEWRYGPGAWEGFQQSVLGHLLSRLGPGGYYWHDVGRRWKGGGAAEQPVVGVTERPATDDRDYAVLSTVGMSCQRMPTVEQYEEETADRIELAVATTLPSQRVGSIFSWLAPYPWRTVDMFAAGDSIAWYDEAGTFPLGPGGEAVLMLDDPNRLFGPVAPDLGGFSFGGDEVRWLWLVPISEAERRLARDEGSDALIERLAAQGRSWIVGG